MSHPKPGDWWCPGSWRGRTDDGDTYEGCDGDPSCEVCHGQTMDRVLEKRVRHEPWITTVQRHGSLKGWANLMASRYGRPVYLVGSAHRETMPRDIDIRIVLSCKEFESRFGDWKEWRMWIAIPSRADQMRRWHVEMAKMNRQGCDHTHLPLDFQVYPMVEAIGYMNLPRHRLDDIPGIVPPWQD